MRLYRKMRKRLESYLMKSWSDTKSKSLEKFYEKNFADQDYENKKGFKRGFDANQFTPDKVVNNLENGIEKIPNEAKELNIPVEEVAGFCFHRLLEDALNKYYLIIEKVGPSAREDLKFHLNSDEYEDTYFRNYESYMKSFKAKMIACEWIAKEFNLGDDAVRVSERNIERVNKLIKMSKTVRESYKGGKYEGSQDPDDALAALDELQEMVYEYHKDMKKEAKILLDEDIEKWMKEN
jgi:hypothetical protein